MKWYIGKSGSYKNQVPVTFEVTGTCVRTYRLSLIRSECLA